MLLLGGLPAPLSLYKPTGDYHVDCLRANGNCKEAPHYHYHTPALFLYAQRDYKCLSLCCSSLLLLRFFYILRLVVPRKVNHVPHAHINGTITLMMQCRLYTLTNLTKKNYLKEQKIFYKNACTITLMTREYIRSNYYI